MGQNPNVGVVEKFKRKLSKKLDIEKLVLFGSRARQNFSDESDFDLLVISKDFEGVPWYLRGKDIYLEWRDSRPLEVLCFTPSEVKRKMEFPVRGIVAEAIETGVSV